MRTSLLPLFALSMVALFSDSIAETKQSKIHCVNSAKGTCVVPMAALYAGSLDDYRGQVVNTVGYLRVFGKQYLLFPDRALAEFTPSETAIVLVDREDRYAKAFELENGRYVRISGRLHAVSEANVEYWAEIDITSSPQRVPTTIDEPLGSFSNR